MSISDEGFVCKKAWIPIQVHWYTNNKEEVPIVSTSECISNLVSISDIEEYIEALEQYKELFTEKDIQDHSLLLHEQGFDIKRYADHEGLIACRKKQRSGYVYVIEAVNLKLFKIGYSKKPEYRLQQLCKQQIPSKLLLICKIFTNNMVALERELHERYVHQRKHGEWFSLNQSEVEEIKLMITGIEP